MTGIAVFNSQNCGIHQSGFTVLCFRNDGSESPGILTSIFTVNDMFEEALQVTRITMTEAEKRQFYDQYIRSLRLNIDRGVIEHRFQAQVNQIKL